MHVNFLISTIRMVHKIRLPVDSKGCVYRVMGLGVSCN
jgi:hypothetical protein